MKTILLLLVVAACSHTSEGGYKKKYHVGDYTSTMAPQEMHNLLHTNMKKCYTQSDYPLYEKTISKFDPETSSGTVSYKIDNQSMGPKTLVLVEVLRASEGSLVKVYSQGDVFRPAGVYRHQVQKWVDGLKVDCHSHGEI